MTRFAREFRKVRRALSRVELMRSSMDDTFALTDVDLLDKDAGRRFLDYYGDRGILTALERYGVKAALARRGWTDPIVETSAAAERHTLLIDALDEDGERDRLVELVVRRDRLQIEDLDRRWEVLTVDWLALRNPRAEFTEERMRLPGQDAPGLGIGERVLEMLYQIVKRFELDGLVNVPEHFHNAVLYAREMPFADPWHQGHLEGLMKALFGEEQLSFAQAAWAVHWGHVHDPDGRPLRWHGEAMLRAMNPRLRAYLASAHYVIEVGKSAARNRYVLDREAFDARWAEEGPALVGPCGKADA